MKNGRYQCKDIPDEPILHFLASIDRPATLFEGYYYSVSQAFPDWVSRNPNRSTNDNLLRAKLKSMIRKGLISGCACGCRGDFTLKIEPIKK